MSEQDPQPWEVGDETSRWLGYFYPETLDPVNPNRGVLRNLPGTRLPDELRRLENAAVELAAQTLERAEPQSHGYDFAELSAIHERLFRNVYGWAGQLRTVDMAKGTNPFEPPMPFTHYGEVEGQVNQLRTYIEGADHFRDQSDANFAYGMARVYNQINQAHPFREGNGRTQRIFLDRLAAESGRELDWRQVKGNANDVVSDRARTTGDLKEMASMIAHITTHPQPTGDPSIRLVKDVLRAANPDTGKHDRQPPEPDQRQRRRPGKDQGNELDL